MEHYLPNKVSLRKMFSTEISVETCVTVMINKALFTMPQYKYITIKVVNDIYAKINL